MKSSQNKILKIGKFILSFFVGYTVLASIGIANINKRINNVRWGFHRDFIRIVFISNVNSVQDFINKKEIGTLEIGNNVYINKYVVEKIKKFNRDGIKIFCFNNKIRVIYDPKIYRIKWFILDGDREQKRYVLDFYFIKKKEEHLVKKLEKKEYNNDYRLLDSGNNNVSLPKLNNKDELSSIWFKTIRNKVKVSGFIESRGALQLDCDKFEDEKYIDTKVRTSFKYDFGDTHDSLLIKKKFYGVFSFQWDLLYIDDVQDERDENFGLYEGYFVINKGHFRIKIGKQVIRWGKTDQVSPVDNVNPQDMRLFIIPPYEERKIPNWIADIEFFKSNLKVEAVLVPFMEPNEVYFFDRDFSIFKELKNSSYDLLDGSSLPLGVRAYLKNYIKNLQVQKEIPGKSIKNLQGGARIGASIGGFDVGFSYLNSFDSNPYIRYFPISGLKIDEDFSGKDLVSQLPSLTIHEGDIVATYIRRNIYGIEFEGIIHDFGLRGEMAYFDKSGFLSNSLNSIHKPTLWYVLGLDYNGENDLYCNIQLSHYHIYNYEDRILYFKRDNVSVLGELSKGFSMGDFKLGVKYSYFISDRSGLINPYFLIKKISNLDVEFGSFIFTGDKDTILGQYDRMDEFYIRFKYYL